MKDGQLVSENYCDTKNDDERASLIFLNYFFGVCEDAA